MFIIIGVPTSSPQDKSCGRSGVGGASVCRLLTSHVRPSNTGIIIITQNELASSLIILTTCKFILHVCKYSSITNPMYTFIPHNNDHVFYSFLPAERVSSSQWRSLHSPLSSSLLPGQQRQPVEAGFRSQPIWSRDTGECEFACRHQPTSRGKEI